MDQYTLTIGGQQVAGDGFFDVINPATGTVLAQAPECTPEQLDRAFAAAAAAFPAWSADEQGRRAAMLEVADLLEKYEVELTELVTREQGKPLTEARWEAVASAAMLRYNASVESMDEILQDDDSYHSTLVRRPVGVVGAIIPWNFPLSAAFMKLAPALRAGTTVVMKPSPYTPLTSLRMAQLVSEVLPPGVLNMVSGGDRLGSLIAGHPTARKITFTGSISAGTAVNVAAAPDLKRVTLELGGNDPAIVLDDVDPAAVAERLFSSSFVNNGQVCVAIKRIYVPENMHSEVVEAMSELARTVKVGDGLEAGTQYGPLANEMQRDRVAELVAAARADGAVISAGGEKADGPGYFYPPTVISGVSDGSRIVTEEQFGPAVPVLSYRSIDEVLARANSGPFGLGSSVWSDDAERASAVARGLDAGSSWINTHGDTPWDQPFGGIKQSGLGVENGPWGLAEFTELQLIRRAKAPIVTDLSVGRVQ